jgi:hypothetical protein
VIRRLWRRLFGPRPMSGDWCCVCMVDLRRGHVWEVREHMENAAEMDPSGGSWMALTYCRKHRPAGAVKA